MVPPANQRIAARNRRRGFTLIELVVSMSIMTILLGAMVSALLISSQALPGKNAAEEQSIAAAEALQQIERELRFATSITSLSATAITFTVADRGHGSAGPETIRYCWTGTDGASLTRSYNGGSSTTVVQNVTDFNITLTNATGVLDHAPRVVLLAGSSNPPSSTDDGMKRDLLLSWGWSVNVVADTATLAAFQAAVANADVVYVSEDSDSARGVNLWYNSTRGVVIEETAALSYYGFVLLPLNNNGYRVRVAVAHPITFGYSVGETISVTQSSHSINRQSVLLLASGCTTLATVSSDCVLGVIDAGGTLIDGSASKSRRVMMPWGASTVLLAIPVDFPFSDVTAAGKKLLRQSLVWAAAPQVCTDALVRLRTRDTNSVTVEARIALLNTPQDSRP